MMLKDDISILIQDLDWNKPITIQQKAISKLVNIDPSLLEMLIQPNDKKYWENAAKVIKQIGFPHIKKILYNLIEWLQDMNWPGTHIVLEIFDLIDKNDIIPIIEKAIICANETDDYMWLGSIKRLIIRKKIQSNDFSNSSIYQLLEKSDW